MMANIRFRSIEGYESFKTKCNFFRCEEEYPGWTGNEKYIIVTDVPEQELLISISTTEQFKDSSSVIPMSVRSRMAK